MDQEERENWLSAGKIAGTAREEARKLVVPGARFIEIAETIEGRIRALGAEPAFPVNISVNEDAAHDTPVHGDERVIGDDDVVKVDIGAQIDGCIGDTAVTVCVGSRGLGLQRAAVDALEKALALAKADLPVIEIGRVIDATIRAAGAKPVANLTGHSIERYTQHAGLTVPNVPTGGGVLSEGQVVAIEPFATDGAGYIHESREGGIYHLIKPSPQRDPAARAALKTVQEKYPELPFASRWIAGAVPANRLPHAFKLLTRVGVLHSYGVLREAGGGLVAQAEHTVIVEKDGCTITTKV